MPFDANGRFVPEEDSVEKRVATIVARDSPLLQHAQTTARKEANRRGLLNSTLAVQAGRQAVIETALPIASQDAAQASLANRQHQGFTETSELEQGRFAQESAESLAARNFTRAETALNRGLQVSESALDRSLTSSESALGREFAGSESAFGRELTREQAELGRTFTATENALGRALTVAENALGRNLTASESAAARAAATAIQQMVIDGEQVLLETQLGNQASEAAIARAFSAAEAELGRDLTASESQATRSSVEEMAKAENELRSELQGAQLASTESIAAGSEAGATARLETELGSRASEGALTREAAATAQGVDIAARTAEQQAAIDANAQQAELDRTAQAELQGNDLATQERLANLSIEANQNLAELDAATRKEVAALDATSAESIATMNVNANDREKATVAAVNFAQQYTTSVDAINSNNNLSPEERTRQLEHAAAVRDDNFSLVEQMYGIELEWTPVEGGGTGGEEVAVNPNSAAGQPAATGIQTQVEVDAGNPDQGTQGQSGGGANALDQGTTSLTAEEIDADGR